MTRDEAFAYLRTAREDLKEVHSPWSYCGAGIQEIRITRLERSLEAFLTVVSLPETEPSQPPTPELPTPPPLVPPPPLTAAPPTEPSEGDGA